MKRCHFSLGVAQGLVFAMRGYGGHIACCLFPGLPYYLYNSDENEKDLDANLQNITLLFTVISVRGQKH